MSHLVNNFIENLQEWFNGAVGEIIFLALADNSIDKNAGILQASGYWLPTYLLT